MSAALAGARRDLVQGATLAMLLTAGTVAGAIVVPLFDMHVLDRILTSRSLESLAALLLFCGAGLVLYAAVAALRAQVLAVVAERVTRRLSPAILRGGLREALGGDLRSGGQALADLHEIRAFLAGSAATAPLDLAVAPLLLWLMALLHPALGWYGVAAVLAMLAMAILTDGAARPRLGRARYAVDQAIGGTAALLRDRTLVEGLGMGPAIARRWRRAQDDAQGALAAATVQGEGWGAAARFLRSLLQIGAIGLSAILVVRHEATPGAVLGANMLLAMLLAPLDAALAQWRAVAGARLAWQRVAAAARADVAPRPEADVAAEGLVLDHVTFHPDGVPTPILAQLSLQVAPGEMVVLTGPNGAGKSTLARIAAGILVPHSGHAAAAGVGAPDAAASGRIGLLPQRPQIMDGTVAENIARFADAMPEALVGAARTAGLHDAIGRLPRGYGTRIGPLDPVLSGGEMQRLALARALYGDPPVVVVDEPDANLDQAGEVVLAQALAAARARGAAVLAVTHRAGLRAIADRVLRLEDGELQEETRQDGH